MAGTRHFAEFADEAGDVWRINIHDAELPGVYTATEMKVGSEGFVLSYSGNNEQQHQPIIGSSVEFTFYEETAAHTQTLDLFYSNPEGRMLLEVYQDPDGDNRLYWRGVILAEQVVRMDEAKPTAVRITASDDLGNLKDIEFDVTLGGLGSSPLTVKNHLVRCLFGLRTAGLWSTGEGFLRYINDVEGYHESLSNPDALEDMSATIPITVEDDGTETPYNCFDILSGLATAMNARVFQSEGVFWFLPIAIHQRVADGVALGPLIKQYDKDANATSWGVSDILDVSSRQEAFSGTTYKKLAGHSFTHLPPAKSVTRTRLFNGNMFVDAGNDDTIVASGWNVTLEDNGRTYDAGTRFRVSGFVEFQVSPDPSYSFAADDSRVHIEVETLLQCGTKFYTPETWGASPSNRYVVDIRTFDRDQGVNMSTAYSWITDDLPSEQTSVDAYVVVKFFDQTGANVTEDFVGEDFFVDARIEVLDDNGANSDQIVYRSTSSDDNVVEVEQGECIFGDPISHSAQGKIRPYITGVGYLDGDWKSSQTTGPVGLHRLGVDEALARQRYATKIHSGTIHGMVLEMWMTIVEDSEYFVPFQMTKTMNLRETNVERFKIAWNSSGITSADDPPRAGGGTRGSTLDMVAVTANTLTGIVQQSKPSIGIVPDTFTGGRSMQTTTDIGPLFTRVSTIEHTSGSTETLAADGYGYAFMNTYIDTATGFGAVYLPKVADSEGRTYKFETDETIGATKYVKIGPDAGEYANGVRIDGAQVFTMDRPYDGIEVICIGGKWYVTDRKEKETGGGGGASALDDLDDVDVGSASDGQVLKYNATDSEWQAAADNDTDAFSDLTDVNPLLSPTPGDLLTWTTVNGGQWNSTSASLAVGGQIDLGDLGNVSEGTGTSGNILVDYNLSGAYWISIPAATWAGTYLALQHLANVSSATPSTGDLLRWNGSQWAPYTPPAAVSYMTIQSSFYTGDGNGDYIPIGGTLSETTSSQYYNRWTAPMSGEVVSARIFTTGSSAGSSTLSISKYPIPMTIDSDTQTIGSANNDVEFTFDTATFVAGDQLRFWFDPTGSPAGVSVTILIKLTHP